MRYVSIDILRTVAIVEMVQVHFVENLSGVPEFAPNGLSASMFAFLSGVSHCLWRDGQQARGRSESDIRTGTIRRGLFLFGLGLLFNVLVWLPDNVFNWDILTLLGASLLVLSVAWRLPGAILLLMCGAIVVVSPLLRAASDYPAYWSNGYFECESTLSDVVLGFLVNGYFPIFPWLIYPVVGFVVASQLFPGSRRAARALDRLTAVGVGLVAAFVAVMLLRSYSPTSVRDVWLSGWRIFPASSEYVLGTLGLALTAFALLHRWVDRAPGGAIARIAALFSAYSLTVYLLHHVVHLWPLWIYGWIVGGEPTLFWQKAMPITWAWPLAFVFLVGCYYVLRWMARTGTPGLETLMRRLCDRDGAARSVARPPETREPRA